MYISVVWFDMGFLIPSIRHVDQRTHLKVHKRCNIVSISTQYPSPLSFTTAPSRTSNNTIQLLAPGSKLPGLTSAELTLLRKKQTSLASTASFTISSLPPSPHLPTALAATLIFAQHEAGTAVCVDPAGWLLTCSHCIGDTEDEYLANKRKWLLFYTGLAVQAECHAWDPQRDLALSKIIAVECTSGTKTTLTPENSQTPMFSSIPLPTREPVENTPIICIGQPGSDDLESTSPRKTGYKCHRAVTGKVSRDGAWSGSAG